MENNCETLSIRITAELERKLKAVSDAIDCDISEIVRRTARYAIRHAKSLPDAKSEGANEREEKNVFLKVRNCPATGMDIDSFRRLLETRCDDAIAKCSIYPSFTTEKVEGIDYIVTAN